MEPISSARPKQKCKRRRLIVTPMLCCFRFHLLSSNDFSRFCETPEFQVCQTILKATAQFKVLAAQLEPDQQEEGIEISADVPANPSPHKGSPAAPSVPSVASVPSALRTVSAISDGSISPLPTHKTLDQGRQHSRRNMLGRHFRLVLDVGSTCMTQRRRQHRLARSTRRLPEALPR